MEQGLKTILFSFSWPPEEILHLQTPLLYPFSLLQVEFYCFPCDLLLPQRDDATYRF